MVPPSPPAPNSAPPPAKLSVWHDLLCGALAGMTARTFVAPLDVLKIRFQVQPVSRGAHAYASLPAAVRTIVAEEGVLALWKGNVPALLMITPYAAIQLAAFYQLRHSPALDVFREPYGSLAFGAVSATAATLATYPLDLMRTRLAVQKQRGGHYDSMSQAVAHVLRNAGPRGLYAGLQPTLVEIVPYMSIHFAIYESSKVALLDNTSERHPRPMQAAAMGAVAGVTSKFLTLPLDNAKKLLQVQAQYQDPNAPTAQYRGVITLLSDMYGRYGLRGCFRGATPSLIKALPNSAITFTIYESAKNWILSRY